MVRLILKKALWHTAVGLLLWAVVGLFSPGKWLYAGWFAGLFAACYLLAAWIVFMKHHGTDLKKLLTRNHGPEVPYYLRGVDKQPRPRLTWAGTRHFFDDDGVPPAAGFSDLTPKQQGAVRELAFGTVAILFFILSAF